MTGLFASGLILLYSLEGRSKYVSITVSLCMPYTLPNKQRTPDIKGLLGFGHPSNTTYVETGRFNNTPLERRLCTCCSLNEIEDEYHFLMICPKYDNLRHNLFSKITDINLNVLSERDKFAKILKFYQKYLANYIVEAFEIRQKLVFNSNNW